MKRSFDEAFDKMDRVEEEYKRTKVEQLQKGASALPKDVWGVVTKYLDNYDIIFLRATSSALYKWCKELKPFPKYFVLDQDKCMEYLVENGFTSLLDYVKNTLRFEWTDQLCSIAAQSGQVSTLQHLVNNGLTLNDQLMLECTKHSCDLSMIKYLHENGVSWDPPAEQHPLQLFGYLGNPTYTPMEYMAQRSHLDCIKYAMENGCTQRAISYTPSIECLDFAIQNGFTWQEDVASKGDEGYTVSFAKKNICEEAARLGDLTMLKYAHQKGAPLKQSASQANQAGHLDCLIYASENEVPKTYPVTSMSRTLDCFKYLTKSGSMAGYPNGELLWMDQVMMGNIETLRYLLANECPLPTDPFSVSYRVTVENSFRSFESFKFVLDELKMSFDITNPYLHCIARSNLEGLKLCFERNLPNKSPAEIQAARPAPQVDFGFPKVPTPADPLVHQLVQRAIQKCNIDVLTLLWEKLSNKEGLDMEQCSIIAARDSTPEICDFLTQQGAQWTSEHLRLTSDSENLPNMAYLTRMGCKWTDDVCASSSPLVIKYARDHFGNEITGINKPKKLLF